MVTSCHRAQDLLWNRTCLCGRQYPDHIRTRGKIGTVLSIMLSTASTRWSPSSNLGLSQKNSCCYQVITSAIRSTTLPPASSRTSRHPQTAACCQSFVAVIAFFYPTQMYEHSARDSTNSLLSTVFSLLLSGRSMMGASPTAAICLDNRSLPDVGRLCPQGIIIVTRETLYSRRWVT